MSLYTIPKWALEKCDAVALESFSLGSSGTQISPRPQSWLTKKSSKHIWDADCVDNLRGLNTTNTNKGILSQVSFLGCVCPDANYNAVEALASFIDLKHLISV